MNRSKQAKKDGYIAGRCLESLDSNPYDSIFLRSTWNDAWQEGSCEVREEEQARNFSDPWEEAKTDLYTSNVFDEGQVQALQEMIDKLREATGNE
jgi:ribosome modulation factor